MWLAAAFIAMMNTFDIEIAGSFLCPTKLFCYSYTFLSPAFSICVLVFWHNT